jgi:enoyl-CoA hydratase
MLRAMLENGPLALRVCIEAVDAALETTVDEGLLLEANYFGLLASTSDMREGMAAFLEKRKPRFTGN